MIDKIKGCIDEKNLIVDEGPKVFDANAKTTGEKLKDNSKILVDILQACDRDKIKITIDNESDYWEISNFLEDDLSIEEILIKIDHDDEVRLSIHIEKEIKDNSLSIYSVSSFFAWLTNRTIGQIMSSFSYLLDKRNYIIFEMLYSNELFFTDTMIFKGKNININKIGFNRLEQLKNCKTASSFYSINEFALLPEDFNIINSYDGNILEEIFEKIKMVLSLAYIANTSNIIEEQLILHIIGQRNFDTVISLNKNSIIYNDEFYKIYKWIYIEGNPVDKAIIARNLISLHCKYTNLISIDEKTFASIQSNYSLYQRDNVNQYIELKNKLSEYILDSCTKISDISNLLIDRLRNNVLAFLTFMLTIFLTNLLSDTPLNNIFTKDIVKIIYLVLAGSIAYLIVTVMEVNANIMRLEKSYYKLKENYNDLLDDQDRELIFKKDEILLSSKEEAEKTKNKIISIWVALLIIASIITITNTTSNEEGVKENNLINATTRSVYEIKLNE